MPRERQANRSQASRTRQPNIGSSRPREGNVSGWGRRVRAVPHTANSPGMHCHQRPDELVEAFELAAGELSAATACRAVRHGRIAGQFSRAGARGDAVPAAGAGRGVLGTRRVDVSGPVADRALAWLIVRVRVPRRAAPGRPSARGPPPAVPSRPFGAPRARPDWAARAALSTASSGSEDLPPGAGPGDRNGPPPRRARRPQ